MTFWRLVVAIVLGGLIGFVLTVGCWIVGMVVLDRTGKNT